MFMSPGNLITHRQKRWKKGRKVQEQIDKFEGQVYITIFDNAINDEKRQCHFLKKIKKAVDHITHLNIKMSTFDLNSRLCLPLPDTKQQKQLTTKTT